MKNATIFNRTPFKLFVAISNILANSSLLHHMWWPCFCLSGIFAVYLGQDSLKEELLWLNGTLFLLWVYGLFIYVL